MGFFRSGTPPGFREPGSSLAVRGGMSLQEVRALNRRSIVVRFPGEAGRDPATCRGTLEVHEDPVVRGLPLVQVVLCFPHLLVGSEVPPTLTLDEKAVAHLLAEHRRGVLELEIERPLSPAPPCRGAT